jgi:hypothetical protein
MATNAPKWLNLHALIDDDMIAELEAVRVEAEALAPAVRQLAIRSFRAAHAFELATKDQSLPDGVWELLKELSGAEAVFEVLGRLLDDLEIGRLEEPNGDSPEWYRRELEIAAQTCGSAEELDDMYPPPEGQVA